MSYINGITEVNNSVVTSLIENMSMTFEIKEINQTHEHELKNLLDDANLYEGNFKLHVQDELIKSISYDTDYSDDWLCHGSDTFAKIIEKCVKKVLRNSK